MKRLHYFLVGVLLLSGCGPKPTILNQVSNQNAEKISFTTSTIRSVTPDADVTVYFPVFANNEKLNLSLKRSLDGFLANFDENSNELENGQKNSLDISFKVVTADPKVVSVYFDVQEYYSGAAHGSVSPFTLNYDLARGEELTLARIFVHEDQVLDWLATYSRKELLTRLTDRDLVEEGTAPTSENFSAFVIREDGSMTWYFAPYQVAPGAEGIQEVTIPYAQLKDKLLSV